ncbi:hypothetical protein AB4Y32_25300 [Paraburkholderia phymatum]|uniref:Uncharacterized protein n=1 Tax=Paraburkholderia phymatum TaxID=148447 RepID=A0ACC6U5X0_9BURK
MSPEDTREKLKILEAEVAILKETIKKLSRELASFIPAGAFIQGQILYVKQR